MYIHNADNYIVKVRINIGTDLGEPRDEDVFIVLREMDTREALKFREYQKKSESEFVDYFFGLLQAIIVDHNIFKSETEKASPEKVAEIIANTLGLTMKVIEKYSEGIFFTSPAAK